MEIDTGNITFDSGARIPHANEPASAEAQQQAPCAQQAPPQQAAYQQQRQQPQPQPQGQPYPQGSPVYEQHPPCPPQQAYQQGYEIPSPFSLGWRDSKEMFSNIGLLVLRALIYVVPILNFCLYGSLGKWGREPVDGVIRPLSAKTVTSESFVSGFFFFVIALAIDAAALILGLFPFVGALVTLVAMLVGNAIAYLMYYRYLSYGSFGAAWNFSALWNIARRSPGSLWVASALPPLICQFIGILATLMSTGTIFFLCFAMLFSGSLAASAAAVLIAIIAAAAAILIMGASAVIGLAWGFRATGYWLARFAPELSYNSVQQELYWQVQQQQRAQQYHQQYQQPYQQQYHQTPYQGQEAPQQAYSNPQSYQEPQQYQEPPQYQQAPAQGQPPLCPHREYHPPQQQ